MSETGIIETGTGLHRASLYSKFRDNIFTLAMHQVLRGEQEIEAALNEACEEAQEMLEAEGL